MAAPHYVQILSGGPRPVWPEPPERLRIGTWKQWYIPLFDSDFASRRALVWIKAPGGGDALEFRLEQDSGCKAQVVVDDVVVVESAVITFSGRDITAKTYQRLKFTLDAVAGTLRVQGATTGNGTYTGTPWAVTAGGGEWRVGTRDGGSNTAAGYVSLPYATQTDDPLPDPNDESGYLLMETGDVILEEGGGGVLLE